MLLTRAPLYKIAFDLHVLSMPPAFVLSQDQTLKFDCPYHNASRRYDLDGYLELKVYP